MDRKKIEYKSEEIEKRWQEVWKKEKTFSPDMKNAKNPFYNLMMFPYPSAEGLHVGNMYAFTGADVYGRFKRMQGFDVFEPIGLDGFGIHSENYALKVGRHPKEQAAISAKNFYRQLAATGNAYDWTKTLETYDEEYYRWTQWIFVQMFKKGLAYRKNAKVNWCPSDKTVLADEQVIDGKCERDGAIVEKRDLEQWFFKITDYADRLLEGLDRIDWPHKIKIAQDNWIGKSEGARIRFEIQDNENSPSSRIQNPESKYIEVFTTRPDTLFGATFMVVAPEHAIVELAEADEVREYVKVAKAKSEAERTEEGKEKTGVFTGLYAINPVNNEEIPVWVADYVLAGYGTGAIMAVPAHDQRDFEFAKKFNLPIKQVISPDSEYGKPLKEMTEAYTGPGGLVNSGDWDDYAVPEAMPKILDYIEKRGIGKREANYHLRDWLISRQRYWGPPIPMIYCKNCASKGKSWFTTEEGKAIYESRKKTHDSLFITHSSSAMVGWYPIPEKDLPVLLPEVEDWRPEGNGVAPLANHPEFYETKCPGCGGEARRETDVSDTFLDSAWYYLRYLSVGTHSDSSTPYDIDIVKKWCPVSIYIGGAEHSVLHLLYVRFVAMVLHDLKTNNDKRITNNELALPFEEPFPRFFAHGLIVKDGAKMSKSRGNVVVPDAYISKFGADTLRMYLMFLGQFSDGGDFRDTGIEGMNRFVKRVWILLTEHSDIQSTRQSESQEHRNSEFSERIRFMHKTIKGVTEDIDRFSYNTAIAKMMEWYNFLSQDNKQSRITRQEAEVFVKLMAPFAPHMTEEIWYRFELGTSRVHKAGWPKYEEQYLIKETVTVAIQVNGKRRGEITVQSVDVKNQNLVEEKARESVAKYLENEVKNVIYIPGKIINFVV